MATGAEEQVTYHDFENLPEGAGHQLVGGIIVHEPTPTIAHQLVVKRMLIALDRFVSAGGLGIVIPSPVDVALAPSEIYQPDILFVAGSRRSIITEQRVEGAPDLVVEVLSLSTAYYDLRHKRNVYAREGVREYWIVDPIAPSLEVLENVDGAFVVRSAAGVEGTVSSVLLEGFSMSTTEIFRLD